MNKVRIALAQIQAVAGKKDKNIEKIREFTRRAAVLGANAVCFPELSVHGYDREGAGLAAECIPGESSQAVVEIARETGITVLAGMLEKRGSLQVELSKENKATAKPYITHIAAFPNGGLVKYRKTHLGRSELPYFTPGNDFPVFCMEKVKFAVQICWDLHFPEVTSIYSLNGAELIFAPHASPFIVGNRRGIWMKYLPARAYDNAVFVAACNLVGDGGGQVYGGGAMVVDPKGDVIAESFSGKEDLLVTDLDPTMINTIRQNKSKSMRHKFYLEDRRPELYWRLIKNSEKQEHHK